MKNSIHSICGMCSVRCPIRVEVADNKVVWIEGNQHLLGGSLCGRGAAGAALLTDNQRPKQPLIRKGHRGEGKWQEVSWDTALDYVAEKLHTIKDQYGSEAVVLSSRGGPWQSIYKTFIYAYGSPNYTDHDNTCGKNTHHASLSLNGVKREGFLYDIRNTKHLVLFGRDLFSALKIDQGLETLDMLDNSGRLTYVDVRQTMTGVKANRFFLVRPGTDYALALALIHGIIEQNGYDQTFIDQYVSGFAELCEFIKPYTPAFAAKECGIKEKAIKDFITEIIEDSPKVIFHPGWNLSRYRDSFYLSRALHILNILMGNIEQPGGLIIPKSSTDCNTQTIRTFSCPVPKIRRADGVGWKYTHLDPDAGMANLFFDGMKNEEPYPIRAWIAMRHDPLTSMPDPKRQKQAFDKCELLVSIDTHYSEFGWYADVILPESTYLERDTPIFVQDGIIPRLHRRQQAVPPSHDTKAGWEIFQALAQRLDLSNYPTFTSIKELWQWQLEPTGFSPEDFNENGFIPLSSEPIMYDPHKLHDQFKTPSGKIEMISDRLSKAGLTSLKEYESPDKPPKGTFRLIYGRSALHTHGQTINNPLLNELLSENRLWINTRAAKKMGISDGDLVEVSTEDTTYTATIPATVTDFIHPEAVFTLHGFGREIPLQKRSYRAGLSDQKLMRGKLHDWDQAGGALCLCQSFVKVQPSTRNRKNRGEL